MYDNRFGGLSVLDTVEDLSKIKGIGTGTYLPQFFFESPRHMYSVNTTVSIDIIFKQI